MRIRVRDKMVVARIREREKAKQEFEEAKAAGKSAALLEQQRPNVFTMAVANILPGDQVEVELTYSEMLVPEQGRTNSFTPRSLVRAIRTLPNPLRLRDKGVKSP
jgi:Ca-activated chloride channel family protein